MVTKCVVPNCGNSCNAKLSVTLFSFPKDLNMVQKWVHATRAQYLKEIKSHHKVCSEHFEKHCILHHFGATRLAPGAIPTIFDWNNVNVIGKGTQACKMSSFVAVRSVNSINQPLLNNRAILPKTTGSTVPKIKIPPLLRRVPLPVPKCAAFNMIKRKPLMCDVILPKAPNVSNHQSTNSAILSYRTPTSICTEPNNHDSDDDRGSNGSEYIIGDVGNYTLSTKKYEDEDEENVDDPPPKIVEPEFGSVCPPSAEECSRDSGNSFIEDIVEYFQDDTADHFGDVKDIPKGGSEIIIEECSIIEEEIIPPEKASSPLSLAAYLEETNLSLSSKDILAEDAGNGATDESVPEKSSNLETRHQVTQKKRPLGSSKSHIVQETKVKLRKLQPKMIAKNPQNSLVPNAASACQLSSPPTVTVNPVTRVSGPQAVTTYLLQQNSPAVLTTPQIKINQLCSPVNGVVSPMVFQVSNMMLPVTSSVIKTAQVGAQNRATNSVNLVTPQMTYLIPFGGVIPPPLAIKTSNSADISELMTSSSQLQNVVISPESAGKDKFPALQKIRQRKQIFCNGGNGNVSKGKSIAGNVSLSIGTDSPEDMTKREGRFSQKIKEMKIALRKRDLLVKKLKRDKMSLTKRLKTLRKAFFNLRKATILNLSSSTYLEVG